MNKLFLVAFFSTLLTAVKAQVKARTENGQEVFLYDNGTWKYVNDSTSATDTETDTIAISATAYKKNSKSSFLLKSKILNVGVYINPNAWTYSPPKPNEVMPEYSFVSKSLNGYGLMMAEKTEIALERMPYIALINAQKAAMDAAIVKKEYRMVNGVRVLCIQIKGTVQGLPFVYLGYYYCNKNGTVQLLTYTSQKLFNESKKELEDFLNGFVVLP